ncbi:MAG: hypothetical protein JXQ99_09345 [Hyphomicrobiaceae bacterium]
MTRDSIRKLFKTAGPAILPVIHALDAPQVDRNVRAAMRAGAHGVFLINHDFARDQLLPIVRHVRQEFPWLWLGVNFLGVTGKDAFPVLGDLLQNGCRVDAYWADDARIDERATEQTEAIDIDAARTSSGWEGMYWGGTAFKKQRDVSPAHYPDAARLACQYMDVVTTSGVATGKAADMTKVETFRTACGDHPLAIASGVTVENVHLYAPLLDAILVATGINKDGDFYNIDPKKLGALLKRVRETCILEPAQ